MAWQMAIAAVAHMFVFSAEPYHYVPVIEYLRLATEITTEEIELDKGDTPDLHETQETKVEAPGTSVTESVQDIVVGGGHHVSTFPWKNIIQVIALRLYIHFSQCQFEQVVRDVVLTINQAIGPVEKGVTKIQETFHHRSIDSDREEESEVKVEERVEENLTSETHIH